MKLTDLIQIFCAEHKNYQFIKDYRAKSETDSGCIGIAFSADRSYMDMLFALTAFLDENGFDDKNLELSNPIIEETSDRIVVCFPNINR